MARPKMSNMKEEILNAVEELIAKRGVNNISLADIANQCGISKGTLYYHYSCKDDILLDLIIRHINCLQTDYDEWLARHTDDLTPERFLSVVFYKGVKLFNRSKMHVYIINECIGQNDYLRVKFLELWNEWTETLKKGIIQIFPNMKDPETYSYLLMLIIDGLVVQEVMQNKTTVSEEKLVQLMKKVGEIDE